MYCQQVDGWIRKKMRRYPFIRKYYQITLASSFTGLRRLLFRLRFWFSFNWCRLGEKNGDILEINWNLYLFIWNWHEIQFSICLKLNFVDTISSSTCHWSHHGQEKFHRYEQNALVQNARNVKVMSCAVVGKNEYVWNNSMNIANNY